MQGKWGQGVPGGCDSYSWKDLSHSCSCGHGVREGRAADEHGRRKGSMFKQLPQLASESTNNHLPRKLT